jgi:predicted RNase H-like HicB family nuclease
MSDYHINVFYSDEDAAYVADIPDLDACSALGASPEEALAEVERAKQAWLSAARGRQADPGAALPPCDLRALALRPRAADCVGGYQAAIARSIRI